MYHYSKPAETDGPGYGATIKRRYWYCGHPDGTKRPKDYDQGCDCTRFEDRYEKQDRVNEWVSEVNKRLRGGKKWKRT